MPTVSARPAALHAFADMAYDISTDLTVQSGRLRGALDHFRSSRGWREFLPEVPPLDVDMVATSDDAARLAKFVAGVASAFERADSSIGPDGIASADQSQVHAPSLEPPKINLVQDGDRTILNTTEGDDHVRVITRDGKTVVEILENDPQQPGQSRVVESRTLTDEQARNFVIRAGAGNDVIEVDPNVPLAITVLGGRGNDEIGGRTRSRGVRIGGSGNDVIYGGEGHDQIDAGAGDDEVYGGQGHDYVDGQDGNDRLAGGDHDDTVYGGRGDDQISGDGGLDYLEGGSGKDALDGGAGSDVLSGGLDDDTLTGGAGDDKLYGGRGADKADGGEGQDTAYEERGEWSLTTERHVTIELTGAPGSHAIRTEKPDWMTEEQFAVWKERIDSDLEFLRTSPTGRRGLEDLDRASRDSDSGWNPFDEDDYILLVPAEQSRGIPASEPDKDYMDPNDDGNFASRVSIDPHTNMLSQRNRMLPDGRPDNTSDWDQIPPAGVLYHELAHAYDDLTDNLPDGEFTEEHNGQREVVSNPERNSVGLDIDHDGDQDLLNDHPGHLTENALRDELGRPRRERYAIPPDRP